MKNFLIYLVKILLAFLSFYVLIFVSVFTFLKLETVQNFVRPYVVTELEKALKTSIWLGRVELDLLDKVVLRDFRIKDQQGETLLSASALKIDILSIPTLGWQAPKDRIKRIKLSTLIVEDAYFNLYRRQRDEAWNLDFLFQGDKEDTPPDTAPGHRIAIDIKDLNIKNLEFRLRDSTFTSAKMEPRLGRLNYTNLHFQGLNLKAAFNWTAEKDFLFNIKNLSARELLSGTELQRFSCFFQAVQESGKPVIRLHKTRYRDAYSELAFDLTMPKLTLDRLFAKGQNRAYQIQFLPSKIDFRSINQFIPANQEGYVPLAGAVEFEGEVRGDYRKLSSSGMRMKYGKNTYLQARFELIDFTKPEMLYLRVNLENTVISSQDAAALFYQTELPDIVRRLGRAKVNAKFTGFLHDFVANGAFELPSGKIESNINLEYNKTQKIWSYNGRLKTYSLNLKELLGMELSKNLNFEGEVTGKDFDPKKAEGEFKFKTRYSDIRGYILDSVAATVKLEKGRVLAKLRVQDKQGNFNGVVETNWQNRRPEFTFLGDVKDLDLQHYGISQKPLKITSIFNIDFDGIHPDSLQGLFRLYRMTLKNLRDSLQLENISARLENYDNGAKHLSVSGKAFDCDIEGIYTFENLGKHLARLAQNAKAAFQDSLPLVSDSLAMRVQLVARNINPILQFFELGATLAPHTTFKGKIELGNVQRFTLEKCKVDSLSWNSVIAQDVYLEGFNLSAYQGKVTSSAHLFCQTLSPTSGFVLSEVRLSPNLFNNLLHFSLDARQKGFNNQYTLSGHAVFQKDTLLVTLLAKRCELVLGDTLVWNFQENPKFRITPEGARLSNFALASRNQRIELEADVIKNAKELGIARFLPLKLDILKNFLPIEAEIGGAFTGEIQLLNMLSNMVASANCQLKNFRYGSTLIGDIILQSDWENEKQELAATAELIRLGDTLISIKGAYRPRATDSPLDFYVQSRRFPLKILQPWVSELLYELDGYAALKNLHCVGKLEAPKLYGSIELHSTIGFTYFQTPYRFDGTVICQGRQIYFPIINNLRLQNLTQLNNKGALKQGASYALFSGFIDFSEPTNPFYDIEVHEIRNFLLLSTTAAHNDIFYGSMVIAQGSAKIVGNTQQLMINAKAVTGPGATLNIPVSQYSEQERLDFVAFAPGIFKDALAAPEKKSGFKLSFNLAVEATPEAEFNLIFDEKVGDKITARGKGQLKLIYTPSGEFNMEGLYEITQGDYLFTFRNILNKRFVINAGSKIAWNGDPYNAQMDIKALYVVDQANIAAWDTTANRINLQVKMNLEGSLTEPRIVFGLEAANQHTLPYAIRNNLRIVENDPQELNRQVFSLLMLNSVAPIGAFFDRYSMQGGVSSSVSEFLSNQLNNWIRQMVDKNINVSFGFNQQVVMFKLRASLLNNRVTIERNGAIASNANRDFSLGNVNIQIKLLPTDKNATAEAGLLAIDIFNRENAISNTVASTSRGAGIFYKKEFDKFSDLFLVKKKIKLKSIPPALPEAKQNTDAIEKK